MAKKGYYSLPELNYKYSGLEPFMSLEQLSLHHQKHHQAYVDGANALIDKLSQFKRGEADLDARSVARELSFHISGHRLHSLFWENLAPSTKAIDAPKKELASAIRKSFGKFEKFKSLFAKTAVSCEGSGWAALVYEKEADRLYITQIEKHNLNLIPETGILLVLDVWEHAYYLDCKNDRAKYIENFWKIVNWDEVLKRFNKLS